MWGFAHQWLVDPWGYGGYGPFHVIVWIILKIVQPAYFRKQTLTRSTPTLVPETS